MVTRTTVSADFSKKTQFSLKAEVLLLLFITIFGLIGLSLCIGSYSSDEGISSNFPTAEEYEWIASNDQKAKT